MDYFVLEVFQKVPALECNSLNCEAAQSCDTIGIQNLGKLDFRIGSDHFILPAAALVQNGPNFCYLNVGDAQDHYDSDTFVFGWQFFLNFAVSFDYSKNEIKAAPTLYGASKGALAV